jgi:hypothetical protein
MEEINHMKTLMKTAALAATLAALSACSSAGGLGSVLGSVLGTGTNSGQQIQASVRSVDTRNQQIALTQTNGSTVNVLYDANTKVVYQNRLYAVTNLESGDQITARIQTTQNNSYYTDSIYVTQSVTTSTSNGTVSSESVQAFTGSVLSVDRNYGTFDIDAGSGVRLTVSMPYTTSTSDASTFNNLRVGNYVRFYGTYLSNTRVQLRNFY